MPLRSQPRTPLICEGHMAQELDLLSLPDDLLAKVALKTRNRQSAWKPWKPTPEPFKDWARAASTCKRLFEMQLPSDPVIRSWKSLEWHLKRFQDAKAIHIHIKEWPSNDEQLSELSNTLQEVPCNLQRLLELIAALTEPLTDIVGCCKTSCPRQGSKALESLHIDAEDLTALREAVQAVVNYQQLRSLSIFCAYASTVSHGLSIPELDLGHLVHLRKCSLQWVPVPGKVLLPQGELELTITPWQVAAWSKLWHQVQAHVHFIIVKGDHPTGLGEWPQGIDAFYGLQFLRLDCRNVVKGMGLGRGKLDLAHLAFIPHVSLYSREVLIVKISRGSWKVLELESTGYLYVDLDDAKGFVGSTKTFCFTFNDILRSEMTKLIQTLHTAGADIGNPVYEYPAMRSPSCGTNSDAPIVVLSNRQQASGRGSDDSAFLSARRGYST